MQKFPVTEKGFKEITAKLLDLKTKERPEIIKAISTARDLGDLSENAEYKAAREKQSFIEGKIQELEDKIARSEVIDISKLSGNTIKFGATVQLVDIDNDKEMTYQIVGEYESDLQKQKISVTSPLARGLIGKEKGDIVEVNAPTGIKEYEILEVKYTVHS
ncbi:MAG: transcription elongation factor GreA [Alphaproteobacteria bacterium]|nr:transcription elongation factor GreA [Alphaproteobacteria bacterium]